MKIFIYVLAMIGVGFLLGALFYFIEQYWWLYQLSKALSGQ